MKKYIYGAVLVAGVIAGSIFLFRSLETGQRVKPATLAITFQLPEGYEFTKGAPFLLTWRDESPAGTLSVPVLDKKFNPLVSPYKFVFSPLPGSQAVVLNARLYYCQKSTRMCFQDDFQTRVALVPEATHAIPCVWEIEPKKKT